jgi:hypothetical protein
VTRSAFVVLSPAVKRPGRGGDHPPSSKLEMRGAVFPIRLHVAHRTAVDSWLGSGWPFGRVFSCAECKLQTGAVGCDICLPCCLSHSDVSSRMHSGNYVYRLL